jgi:hypothetical protein
LTTTRVFECKNSNNAIRSKNNEGPCFGEEELIALEPFNEKGKLRTSEYKPNYKI